MRGTTMVVVAIHRVLPVVAPARCRHRTCRGGGHFRRQAGTCAARCRLWGIDRGRWIGECDERTTTCTTPGSAACRRGGWEDSTRWEGCSQTSAGRRENPPKATPTGLGQGRRGCRRVLPGQRPTELRRLARATAGGRPGERRTSVAQALRADADRTAEASAVTSAAGDTGFCRRGRWRSAGARPSRS